MTEPSITTQHASDGYAIHTLVWPAATSLRGRVVVVHGVQSHSGWYHDLGRTLAEAGYETHFPDRRGSGANKSDRGHTTSAKRLVLDLAERLESLGRLDPSVPLSLVGISWGGKLVVIAAAEYPGLVDNFALVCPGLEPRVGVSFGEKLRIALAFFTNRRKYFPIPLSDPALFTANPERQRFIASDPLSLRAATAGLLAASTFIDRKVRRLPAHIKQPCLLMLAGKDRIVDNARTLTYFKRIASPEKKVIDYPDGHHTLEFDTDPSLYTRDLISWLNSHSRANAIETGRVGG